jgi:vacuolar-type H+-ATPase subunit I/STV1
LKRIFLGILFLLFGFANFLNAQELTLDEVKKKALTVTKEFESKLKKELKNAKREGGIKAMTEYCINDSKKILEKMNNKYNPQISIKRVSLNNRNSKAKPLEDEVKILKAFDLIQKSDAYEPEQIVQVISDTKYKVYSPIQMNSRDCKKCHGLENKVNKESQKRFFEVYKNKKGFGHKSGDIRGAVVVTISK